ncbi:MAG: CotH kinase family protein [Planctomycetota bacterium]|jgi:spore coat protein CotH
MIQREAKMGNHRFLCFVMAVTVLPLSALLAGEKEEPTPDFDAVFLEDSVPTYHLHIPPENWKALVAAPAKKTYVRATLVYTREGREERYPDVGVRFKGNFSLRFAQKKRSFKIDFDLFNPKQNFHGFVKINLHNNLMNPTHIRERLAYDLFRKAGVPCPRATHANLVLTIPGLREGEPMGIYGVVEQIDERFLANRFGDGTGTLLKAKERADFRWKGRDPKAYEPHFDQKTNLEEGPAEKLFQCLHILNKTPDEDFEAAIEKVFNVESFLAFLAVNTLLSNFDAYPALARNYYIYDNPKTGKIEFIPWDMNAVFGIATEYFRMAPSTMYTYDILNPHLSRPRPLVSRLLKVPAFRERYLKIVRKIAGTLFSMESMEKEIDRVAGAIRKAVHEDAKKTFPNEVFEHCLERDMTLPVSALPGIREYTVPGLKSFVRKRLTAVMKMLDTVSGDDGR